MGVQRFWRSLAPGPTGVEEEHHEHFEALFRCTERLEGKVEVAEFVSIVERCMSSSKFTIGHRNKAIALLRTLPRDPQVGGIRRYNLLGKLGALRRIEDLLQALEESSIGPRYAPDSAALLNQALQIPAKKEDEPPELSNLRIGAERWHQNTSAEREKWLAESLCERPLDLPLLPEPPLIVAQKTAPSSAEERDQLLQSLHSELAQERQRVRTCCSTGRKAKARHSCSRPLWPAG